MPSYPVSPLLASDAADGAGWPPDLPGGGLVAIRLADLACPVRRVLREGDRTALTAAGAAGSAAGTWWCSASRSSSRPRWSAATGACRPRAPGGSRPAGGSGAAAG